MEQQAASFAVESKAFEAYATSRKLSLQQHPLHYLFLDQLTNEARSAWKAALTFASTAQPNHHEQEAVDFDYPEFHHEGMGCGLEDRGITDRYEAMRYGFEQAVEQMASILESMGPLYAAPPVPVSDTPRALAIDVEAAAQVLHCAESESTLEGARELAKQVLEAARLPVNQEPDVFLVQAVVDGNAWEHRWWVPRWGDPNPSALDGTVYEIRGKKCPDLGTYRVKPFFAHPSAHAVDWSKFRELAEHWVLQNHQPAAVCAQELKALIDSHS